MKNKKENSASNKSSVAKPIQKAMASIKPSASKGLQVTDTSGGEMPYPIANQGYAQADVSKAFKKVKKAISAQD